MVRKGDRFWDYAERSDGKFTCKFCYKRFSGGAPRVKSHLSGIKSRGIDICDKVPEDVQLAAAEAISGPNKRAKVEACSGNTEETLLKMHTGKDSVTLDNFLIKFILLSGVDVNIVQIPSFIKFVNAVAEHGSHYKLPCHSVVKTKLVPDLEKEIREHVAIVKKSWVGTGCTLICDIHTELRRPIIYIFAYSIKGVVLLNVLEMHDKEITRDFLGDILHFVTQDIGGNNVVQCISNSSIEIMPDDDHPHVYRTKCVAYATQLLFKCIYDEIQWVQKTFNQARALVTKIHKHDGILSSMKQFLNYWEWKSSSTPEFYLDYYMLRSVMAVERDLQLLVSSSEQISLDFKKDESGIEVGEIIHSSEFWCVGKEVLRALGPIFRVLCLVDDRNDASWFLYAAVEEAEEAIRQICETDGPKYQPLWNMFKQWQGNVIHPIHAAAAFLNPAHMWSKKFINNDQMENGMKFISQNLVGGEEKLKFEEEMNRYHQQLPELFTSLDVSMLGSSDPCDWWGHFGDHFPLLKKYVSRIRSQPCSTSFCNQSLSACETAETDKREPLMSAVMDDSHYLRTNVLLMENFNKMRRRNRKPLHLAKLSELPNFTEIINESFTPDLLNKTKAPLSDGKLNCWSASARKAGESKKRLRLHFITKLPSRLVKGDKVKSERGGPIHVVLVDSSTGRFVQSELKLMVTVIEGGLDEEASIWNMGQEASMPLLTGDLSVTVDRGVGTLGDIAFTDVSTRTRSGKFRLGVKIAPACSEGIRVLEGTSNAFTVEDVGMTHDAGEGWMTGDSGGYPYAFPETDLWENYSLPFNNEVSTLSSPLGPASRFDFI